MRLRSLGLAAVVAQFAVVVALAIVALPLLGAADLRPAPIVIVYPLTLTGGTNPEAGANLAVLMSTKMASGGGVNVIPYPPGTERSDFLSAARRANADYYVTGYLTPLGTDVSMLAQVVSCYSGTVIYSTTTMVRTYAEAASQADILREAILRHAGRGQSLEQPPPTSTPAPSASAKQEGLTNLTSGLFHHKKAAPSPSPSPTPSTTPVAAPTVAPT